MQLTNDTESLKLFRVELDGEAFEFNDDIELNWADIEYYVFSETFNAWAKSSLVSLRREYPITYSELHDKLIAAYLNYKEQMWLDTQGGTINQRMA